MNNGDFIENQPLIGIHEDKKTKVPWCCLCFCMILCLFCILGLAGLFVGIMFFGGMAGVIPWGNLVWPGNICQYRYSFPQNRHNLTELFNIYQTSAKIPPFAL